MVALAVAFFIFPVRMKMQVMSDDDFPMGGSSSGDDEMDMLPPQPRVSSPTISIPRPQRSHRRQYSDANHLPKPQSIFQSIEVPTPSSSLPTPDFPLHTDILTRQTVSPLVTPEAPKKRNFTSASRYSTHRSRSSPATSLQILHCSLPTMGINGIADLHNPAFSKIQPIGSGSQSNVYKAFHSEDNCWYAIKVLKQRVSGFSQRQRIEKQITNLQILTPHPHILGYSGTWEHEDEVFLKMNLCKESLSDFLTRWQQEQGPSKFLGEPLLWKFLTDIALGLNKLQQHNLMHRDIKPGNLFLDHQQNVVIADFGLLLPESESDDGREGDSRYLATEILSDDICTHKGDIFSFGATMLELSCLIDMPKSDGPWETLRAGDISSLFPSVYSDAYKILISQMMSRDYTLRPSASAILEHPSVSAILQQRYTSRPKEYWENIKISRQPTGPRRVRSKSSPGISTRVLRPRKLVGRK